YNNMESEFVYLTFDETCINTDIMELDYVFETFNDYIYNSTTDIIDHIHNRTIDVIELEYTFETLMKIFAYSNSYISQNMILQVYNLISDRHCGFGLLAIALFKNEKR
ncbi:14294_t:CDS:2, partial [Dentiscutata erythropus]